MPVLRVPCDASKIHPMLCTAIQQLFHQRPDVVPNLKIPRQIVTRTGWDITESNLFEMLHPLYGFIERSVSAEHN